MFYKVRFPVVDITHIWTECCAQQFSNKVKYECHTLQIGSFGGISLINLYGDMWTGIFKVRF